MHPTKPTFPMRRLALHALAWAALAGPLAGCAMPAVAQSRPLQLDVIDRDTGSMLALVRAPGGRSYVAGTPGARYALRLSNRSAQRVLVVLSVDGVNVITGETATWQQTGYVIEPWQTHDITGWRKSDTAVAAFEFAALRDSYAAQTGRPGNVGVIGAAVFLEKPVPLPMPPVATAPANATAPAKAMADASSKAAAAAPESVGAMRAEPAQRERLGTGHGAQEWSVTRRTAFERASRSPAAVVEIGYDSRENLIAAGILPPPQPPQLAQPHAFAQEPPWPGYVPDPPRR